MNAIRTHLSAAALLLAAAGPATLAADDEVAWIADSHGCKVANTFPRPGETITWSGSCSNGYADGDGVLQERARDLTEVSPPARQVATILPGP